MDPTPEHDVPQNHRSWTDENARALILPVVGVFGVLVVAALAALTDVDSDVIVAGITAIVTLTAAAAGHAAGAARPKPDHADAARSENRG
jgi:hypothetical protein